MKEYFGVSFEHACHVGLSAECFTQNEHWNDVFWFLTNLSELCMAVGLKFR